MKRTTSPAGIALIKKFEGTRLACYRCPAGVLTIGTGHVDPSLKLGMKITAEEADRLLVEDLAKFEAAVNDLVKVPLTQGQFDGLAAFVFNVGIQAFKNSTLLRLLNKKQYSEASQEFGRWIHANGQLLPGLVRRRQAERELFLGSDRAV